jgi:hypothetical protein
VIAGYFCYSVVERVGGGGGGVWEQVLKHTY